MDPYATLGVARDADAKQIRAAFLHASKQTHPDHGGTTEAFGAVKRAHTVLASPEARKRYDETGELPPEQAVNPDQGALSIIAGMLAGLIDKLDADIFSNDVLIVMRQNLSDGIRSCENAIADLERKIARAEKLKGRFTTKPKQKKAPPNFLEGMIAGRVLEYRRAIEMHRSNAAPARRAMEILKDYQYRADAPEMVMQLFGGTFTPTSTGGSWP